MSENIQEEIENKIIDQITAIASGRLIVFKPEKSDLGADLVVEHRGKYKEEPLSFKVISFVGATSKNDFSKEILESELKIDEDLYLLFVYFDEVKQKINDYGWLIPSLSFKDIADTYGEEKKIFKFEASLKVNSKDKYSRYIINIKEFGKLLVDAFESGGKFHFKETGAEEDKVINLESLREFIVEARTSTFASNAISVDNPRLLNSIQLEFQKADYFYRDIYFTGKNNFIGQEIVYKNNTAIWGMNYVGGAIDKNTEKFLKDSLVRLVKKCRLGEPCEFEKREYKYQNTGSGSLENFSGEEYIFLEGKKTYTLTYKGGLI